MTKKIFQVEHIEQVTKNLRTHGKKTLGQQRIIFNNNPPATSYKKIPHKLDDYSLGESGPLNEYSEDVIENLLLGQQYNQDNCFFL